MSLVVNGQTFDIEIDENQAIKAAKDVEIMPCYVPGNFPWQAVNLKYNDLLLCKGVQKMIIQANDRKYLGDFVDIYNSAILLFQPEESAKATPEVFEPQLENDTSIIEINESGNADAFLSYHSYGKQYELTSLYVKSECQNRGLGQKLIIYFESQVPRESIVFVKALNNAPWSINFYGKNGYAPIDDDIKELATSLGILERPWATILYKIIS